MTHPTDKESVAALLPCPMCGCDEAGYHIGDHSFADVKIMCGNCCLESPLFDSHGDLEPAKAMNKADALAYWNRRAPSPAQGDGFPVIKVPGHIVNHMEWKDGAIIVKIDASQGMRDALVKVRQYLKCEPLWNAIPDMDRPTQTLGMMIDAALASHPVPGMTDAAARKLLAEP